MMRFDAKTALAVACVVMLGCLLAPAPGGAQGLPAQERLLEDFEKTPQGWSGDVVEARGGRAGKLVVDKTDGPVAAALNLAGRDVESDEWQELVFDYQISSPGLGWWGVKILDYPLADGWQATWQITDEALLTPGEWHTAVIALQAPLWRWGDTPSESGQTLWFRAQLATGAKPVTVLVDNVRYRRASVRLSVIEEGETHVTEGRLSRTFRLALVNSSDQALACRLEADGDLEHLRLPGLPRAVSLSAGERAELEQAVEVPDLARAPRLRELAARLRLCRTDTGADIPLAEKVVSVSVPLGRVPHPVLLIRRDEVAEVLEAAEKIPSLGGALKSLLAGADSWLTRPLDYPDRGSQWWHWYTCKKCGSRLTTESPTRHVCPSCGEAYSGWPYDDVVLDRQHSALANGARDLALAYLLTGKAEYARRAVEILLGYAERYEKYPLHDIHGKPTGGGHVGPQTLDEAVWLIPIAQAFDAVQDTLRDEERGQIVEHLLMPAAKTTWSPRMGIHNISCWRNSAYGLVGLALDDEEMVRAAYSGPSGFRDQLEKGVIPPGVWYEGAWGYHFYTMSALLPFVEAGTRAGLDVLLDQCRAMYEAPVDFVAPDMLLPAFNDSGYVNLAGSAGIYAIASRHWPDPRLAWVAAMKPPGSWTGLVWAARDLPAAEARFTSRLHPEAGYAVFRTDPWGAPQDSPMPRNYLALDFGPHGGGHGHPDKLSFAWWAQGELMAPDAGSIAYGNPMHGGYYRQTLAHNTLVVDGKSQSACTGRVLFYAAEGNLGLVGASADDACKPVKFSRILAVSGGRVLDVTLASDEQEHRYEWVYHNRGTFEAEADWATMDAAPEGAGYSWCHDWRRSEPGGPLTARWVQESGAGVALCHLPQRGEVLLTATGPDQPASLLVPFVVEQVRARDTMWVNVLQAFSGEAPAMAARLIPVEAAPEGSQAFALEAGDGVHRDVLLVSTTGGEIRAGDYRLRGQAALLHFAEDTLRDVLVVGDAAVWLGAERVE